MSSEEQVPFEVAHVDDIPTLPTDGAPPWKAVRRHLGISSFGVNAFLGGPGDHVIEEHTETAGGAAGAAGTARQATAGRLAGSGPW